MGAIKALLNNSNAYCSFEALSCWLTALSAWWGKRIVKYSVWQRTNQPLLLKTFQAINCMQPVMKRVVFKTTISFDDGFILKLTASWHSLLPMGRSLNPCSWPHGVRELLILGSVFCEFVGAQIGSCMKALSHINLLSKKMIGVDMGSHAVILT